MKLVHANEATAAQRRVYFHLVDATDGITAETGEGSGQPQISTNGGAWTNTGIGTLTHIGNGRYYADLTQAAVLTAGDHIETRYKSAETAETPGDSVHVVAFDPNDSDDLGLASIVAILADTNELQTDDVPGLIAALNDPDAAAIADAVLDELVTDHTTEDSLSQTITDIKNIANSIGTGVGGALSYAPDTDNTGGAIKSISFVGVQTGTYANCEGEDGTYHVIDDTGNAIDIVYGFSVGGGRSATEVIFKGFLNGGNDELNIMAYDFDGTAWDTRALLDGKAGTTNDTQTIPLLPKHTGSGADLGKVYIRFQNTGQTNPDLNVDELLVQAVSLNQTIGYAEGAIWVDTNASNTNTESYVDGTADNPVSTWAAALTLSGQLNITRFHILNNSTVTLSGDSSNYSMFGSNWSLAMAGQNIAGAYIEGADVSGIGVAATLARFRNCEFGTCTLGLFEAEFCGLNDTITLSTPGDVVIRDSHSMVAGTSTPSIDVGAGVANTNLSIRSYSGGIEFQNLGANGTDNVSLEGWGQIVLNANCSGGTIACRGSFTVTDNAGGAVTLSDDARIDVNQINSEVDTALADIHLDHLFAADYNPASKPGTATALLNELVESDGGVSRFTANALEEGPSGSGTVDANLIQIEGHALAGTGTQIADGFENFFDVATPTKDMEDVGVGSGSLTQENIADIVDGVVTQYRLGSGSVTHTFTVSSGGVPIEGAVVEAKVSGSSTTVSIQRTDVSGVATFYLEAGTYDFYTRKSGYTFTNPSTEVVS